MPNDFEKKSALLNLLDKSYQADGMQIFIGQESGYQALDECSVITAPYHANGEVLGTIGVIGPTRMAYERVIPIVDITAKLLSNSIQLITSKVYKNVVGLTIPDKTMDRLTCKKR